MDAHAAFRFRRYPSTVRTGETGQPRWLWPLLLGMGLQTFAWNVCLPFLPLRIQELGLSDPGQVARQSGFLAASRASSGQVGRVIGDMQAASQVGMTLGPLLGGLVASRLGTRQTFFVSAALSLSAVAMAVSLLPLDTGRTIQRSKAEGMAAAWRRPGQRRLMAILMIGDAGIVGLRPLIPVILSARITDPATLAATTGVTTTLATAGAIAAAIAIGRIGRWVSPQRVLRLTLPVTALCVALVPFIKDVPVLIALWALSGFASGATTPAVFAWLGRITPTTSATGASSGAGSSTGAGAATGGYALLANTSMATYALGPILMGQLSATSLNLPFFVAAVSVVVAASLAIPFWRTHGTIAESGTD